MQLSCMMYGFSFAVLSSPLSLPRILLQLISFHYHRPREPPPTTAAASPLLPVRMQPLNPSPDNGKSARWSLFPVSHPQLPNSERMQAISQPQTPSFKLSAHKEGGLAGVCGMGLPSTEARVEAVPIIHLLVLGEGDRLEPEQKPPPLPRPQYCSAPFAQHC